MYNLLEIGDNNEKVILFSGIGWNLTAAQASNNHQCPIGVHGMTLVNVKDGVSCGKRTKDCPIGCYMKPCIKSVYLTQITQIKM